MIKPVYVLFSLLMSCNSTNPAIAQKLLSFDIILEHATGGRITEDIVIVSDQNALEEIYSEINSNQEPNYELPVIDFKKELVLVFFMGEKNTGGYSISVDKINETTEQVNVYYKEKSPKPTDMVTMSFTQPYCIVKIKKTSKELKLLKL